MDQNLQNCEESLQELQEREQIRIDFLQKMSSDQKVEKSSSEGLSTEDHNKYIQIAISEAQYAVENKIGGPFGAVIVKDGEIIAQGHNEIFKNLDPSAHGEVQTIRKACQKLNTLSLQGCVMYSSCEPCLMCQSTCIFAKLDKVYYAMSAQDLEDVRSFIKKDYALDQANLEESKRDIPYQQIQQFAQQAKSLFKPL